MRRHELTEEQFDKIKDFIPGREGTVGVTGQDNRLFINAVIWIFKTGAPWRDLPERLGKWSSVHKRFTRWSKSRVFDKIFRILSEDADMEFLLMDGTIVKAHQHAAGAKKKKIPPMKTKP
jgi:transposase